MWICRIQLRSTTEHYDPLRADPTKSIHHYGTVVRNTLILATSMSSGSMPEHHKVLPHDGAEEIPGYPSARARYVPATVFGVQTSSFDYNALLPSANPELTVWALMHAINGCSSKVIKILSERRVSSHCISSMVDLSLTRSEACPPAGAAHQGRQPVAQACSLQHQSEKQPEL